jgi:hypothetical protein
MDATTVMVICTVTVLTGLALAAGRVAVLASFVAPTIAPPTKYCRYRNIGLCHILTYYALSGLKIAPLSAIFNWYFNKTA